MKAMRIPRLAWVLVWSVILVLLVGIGLAPSDAVAIWFGTAGINASFAPLVGRAASKKGRNFWAFFWIAMVLSVLIPAVIVATMKQAEPASEVREKICPRCAESVKSAALVCRFCSFNFAENSTVNKPVPAPSSENELDGEAELPSPRVLKIGANKFAIVAIIASFFSLIEASVVALAFVGVSPIPARLWPFSFGYVFFFSANALVSGGAGFAASILSARQREKHRSLAVVIASTGFLLACALFLLVLLT